MRILTNYVAACWFLTAAAAGVTPCSAGNMRTDLPFPSIPSFAKEGGIIEGHNLVWGENTGWVNLGARHGDLRIGSNVLAGWIWLENCGWVCVGDGKPSAGGRYSNGNGHDWGVNNDGAGNLSGFAWSEVTGWINFGTDYSRVSLDGKGRFHGYAWGENVGWMRFGPGGRVSYLAQADPGPWKEIGTETGRRLEGHGVAGESYVRSGHGSVSGLSRSSERYDEHDGIISAGIVDGAGVCGYVPALDRPVRVDEGAGRGYVRGPPMGKTGNLAI